MDPVDGGGRRRAWTRRTAVMAAVVTGGALAPLTVGGTAQADETHLASHNGPQVALISTGQIDDPLEDVLEHATVLP